MSAPSPEFHNSGLVKFNGLNVKKTTVPTLVESLVKSDTTHAPEGEDLEDVRRREIVSLMEGCLDQESALKLLSSLEADSIGLRYLTGLMAART